MRGDFGIATNIRTKETFKFQYTYTINYINRKKECIMSIFGKNSPNSDYIVISLRDKLKIQKLKQRNQLYYVRNTVSNTEFFMMLQKATPKVSEYFKILNNIELCQELAKP